MTTSPAGRGRGPRLAADSGAAMILVIGLAAVITFLSVTVATVALNNLGNTTRDKQAAAAFATSEAGVAAAIERIRSGSLPLSSLTCIEPVAPTGTLPASCTGAAMSWTSSVNPMQVRADGQAGACVPNLSCYTVWIGTVSPFNPPAVRSGVYRVHSKGLSGNGPAARSVVVELEIRPERFPIGVYGEMVTGQGGTVVEGMSLFTRACVSPRQTGSGAGTRFFGHDVFWDQPAAAHSTSLVSTINGCGASGDIHRTGACPSNFALQKDQSVNGGPLTSGPCYRTYQRMDGSWYPDALPSNNCAVRSDGLCDSTKFTMDDLKRYGYTPRGLTDDQYEALRNRAQVTGTANVPSSSLLTQLTAALNAGINQPVVYVDCVASPTSCDNGTYRLSSSDLPAAFQQPPGTGTSRCSSGPQPVITLVVERGNLTFQGGNNTWIDAAIFVPDGQWRGDGGYNVLGTLFSNNLSLGGNEKFQLDPCFVRDLPAPLLHIEVLEFREDDGRDVN